MPGVEDIEVLATELFDHYAFPWAALQRWSRHAHPRIKLRTRLQDLAADPLPDAGLTLAMHPEATKGGAWFPIIGSIINSTRAGVCVFAMFYDHELQTVLNMVDMYSAEGSNVDVAENPYYASHEPGRSIGADLAEADASLVNARPEVVSELLGVRPQDMRHLVIVTGASL